MSDTGLEVQEAHPKLEKPRLYKVVLMNDDYIIVVGKVVKVLSFFSRKDKHANP